MALRLQPRRFPFPVSAIDVRADWRQRGFSCHDFADPPGRQWNDFVHATNELVTVLEGRLRLMVAGEILELAPGDEAFIARGELHSVHNIHSGHSRWLFGYD